MKTEEHDEDINSTQPEITELKDNLGEGVPRRVTPLNKRIKSKGKSELDLDTNDATVKNTKVNLDLILDVPVDLEIELGRKRMPLEEVLELETDSILLLDKKADDPVEVYINGTLIATGMLITVDERDTLGLQVIAIADRTKRIRSLE